MATQDSPRAAVEQFILDVAAATRIRQEDVMLERIENALENLRSAADVDLPFLEASLRARPDALNLLLGTDGELMEALKNDTIGTAASYQMSDWYDECFDGLEAHFARITIRHGIAERNIPDCGATFRPASPAPGRGPNALIGDFYFFADFAPGNKVVWDRRVFDIENPVLSMLATQEEDVPIAFDPTPLPRWQPGPLFRYHPERFKQTRGYAREILASRDGRGAPETPELWQARLNSEMNIIGAALNEQLVRSPLRNRASDIVSTATMHTESNLFTIYDQFEGAGRQIFDIPLMLVEMFRHTKVDDVPLSLLHSPYNSYYLHFSPQEGLEIEPGWAVDGAYVTHIEKHSLLQIVLVGRPETDSDVRNWFKSAEPIYTAVFDKATATMDVGTALDTVFSNKLAELDREISVGNIEMQANLEEARKTLLGEGVDLSHMKIVPTVSQNGAERAETLKRRLPVFRDALCLVINSMCYMTAYPEDLDPQWPIDAPARLVEKATAISGKAAARAKSQLESLGYRAVHLCGKHYRRTTLGEYESTDITKKRHFRRGHWKRQPYGEARALRKLQWRMPVIVNRDLPDDDGDEITGHLYMVT